MDLSGLGATTGGAWTTADALAAGLSRAAVARRVRSGEWTRLHRGVLTDGAAADDCVARAWGAVLAVGGPQRACAAGRTTARLLDLPLLDDPTEAPRREDEVAVPASRHPRTVPRLLVHRLASAEVTTHRGCPSLTLRCALPGLAMALTGEALVCLLDAAQHRGLISRAELDAVVQRHAGRAGSARLGRAVAESCAAAESPAETLARLLLRPVLPELQPQVLLLDAAARPVARFDLADRRLRLAVEVDGARGHAGAAMVAKDRARDRRTEALGWTTERCTWGELRHRPEVLRERVLATARRLAARSGAA